MTQVIFAVPRELTLAERAPRLAPIIWLCLVVLPACTMSQNANARVPGQLPARITAEPAQFESQSPTALASQAVSASDSVEQFPDSSDDKDAEEFSTPSTFSVADTASTAVGRATDTPIASHRVVAGDTLTRIAQKYGVSVASLLSANDLPNPDFLEVGQVIVLPQPPIDYSPSFRILPDSRLVRSASASDFNIGRFLESRGGALSRMTAPVPRRKEDGSTEHEVLDASDVIERVSLEYSVDPRILIGFLEHFAGLVSKRDVDSEAQLHPLIDDEESGLVDRTGLYSQLSWLADRLNRGYYGWKYRDEVILEMPDGRRLFYGPNLNAGTIAVQFALTQMPRAAGWAQESQESGLYRSYSQLFGDPFESDVVTVPADLAQPRLSLPFPPGVIWRYTGGFHGGWGNGSAWAAVDFSPPAEARQVGACYTSSFPVTSVARGTIARLDEGIVVLDLDHDMNEGSGWTILYLHVDHHDGMSVGQLVEPGNIIGYPSCLGGFTTATHLHIARRYNGEWIPADCNRCPTGITVPPFVMSNWRVVGLESQLYQGFMVNELDNRSAVAEQGRFTSINEISW